VICKTELKSFLYYYLLPPLFGDELPLEPPPDGADLGTLLLDGADIDPDDDLPLGALKLLLELLLLLTAGELDLFERGDTFGEVR
jgi:hypothetical protein